MKKTPVATYLDPHADFETIRDALRLLRSEYVNERILNERWKHDLASYLQLTIKYHENKDVKLSSIIRNIDRMIAFYEQSGAQARSGKRYLFYIEKFFEETYQKMFETAHALGGGIAQRFITLEDALIYKADISILKIAFDPKTKLFVVFRFPSEVERGRVAQQG